VISISDLPTLNATLNAISAVLLTAGYLLIRQRRQVAHRNCMIAAFVVSALFLVSYLTYHYHAGSKHFAAQGWIRPVYFTILISHIILAFTILPLALRTLYLAWRKRFAQHRRIARLTLPIWLYVSVTGVIIYWMLYHLQ
jgi:putative membrane protein